MFSLYEDNEDLQASIPIIGTRRCRYASQKGPHAFSDPCQFCQNHICASFSSSSYELQGPSIRISECRRSSFQTHLEDRQLDSFPWSFEMSNG
jgi:hypothetical protein